MEEIAKECLIRHTIAYPKVSVQSVKRLEVGGVYRGELDESGQRVYITDQAGGEWVFYVGDTCKIISL